MGGGGGEGWSECSLAKYSVAYEETQSNRVSDFREASVVSYVAFVILLLVLHFSFF